MKIRILYIVLPAAVLLFLTGGCAEDAKKAPPAPIQGKITSFAEVAASGIVPVEGYGLVVGLAGTGSGQCTPMVRNYLKRYILKKLPKDSTVTAEQLLASSNTAAVKIEGIIPAVASKGENFDLRITPAAGSQTTSLAGGRLYTSNLAFGTSSMAVATGQGPVFVDMLGESSPTTGYVLGGGSVREEYGLAVVLYQSDFRVASIIRNRINERFGEETVARSSAAVLHIGIPQKYVQQKTRFTALLKELHVNESPQQEVLRSEQLIKELGDNEKGFNAEIALEAIGRTAENKIAAALNSENTQTRFRAARCLLNFGSDAGLSVLRQTAMDATSPYRGEAIEAIAISAKRNDAVIIIKQFLSESDFKVRLAAYEQLRRLGDTAISTVRVADDFEVDQVFTAGPKMIYVYRSGKPRIVLFGAPLVASENIFIESADGSVILNSLEEHKYVTIVRRHPKGNVVLGPVKSGFDIVDIIGTLSASPASDPRKTVRLGLGVSYDDTIAILKTMCDKGAAEAEFAAGPMPVFKSGAKPNVMESPPSGR